MSTHEKLYDDRDIEALDEKGNYYFRHVMAMTAEQLDSKAKICAELGYRDFIIDELRKQITELGATPNA